MTDHESQLQGFDSAADKQEQAELTASLIQAASRHFTSVLTPLGHRIFKFCTEEDKGIAQLFWSEMPELMIKNAVLGKRESTGEEKAFSPQGFRERINTKALKIMDVTETWRKLSFEKENHTEQTRQEAQEFLAVLNKITSSMWQHEPAVEKELLSHPAIVRGLFSCVTMLGKKAQSYDLLLWAGWKEQEIQEQEEFVFEFNALLVAKERGLERKESETFAEFVKSILRVGKTTAKVERN